MEGGLVDVHLQVAGADCDFAVKQDGLPLVLHLLPFQRVDEAGLRQVVRHVHPRRALPLDLFAALLDDAGVQHGLRQLLPNLGLELADQLPDRSGNGDPHGVLRDELADVLKLDLSFLQFHVEGRFLARELHNAADPDAQNFGNALAQQRPRGRRIGTGAIPRTRLLRCALRAGGRGVAGRGAGCWCVRKGRRRVHAGAAPGRSCNGPLKVVHARPVLLRELASVVNDQVHDLLLIQASLGPKNRERQVISRLALVLQVVALPQPGILEAHVRSHPAVKHLLRDARVGIDQERLVREAFGPLPCRVLLCLRVGNRGVVEVLCEIGEVVSPVGERMDHNILRVGGVLEIPGPRNPQYPGQVGEAVVGPPARRSIQAQQRVPPGHLAGGGLAIIVAVEDVRFLEEPPGVRAVAGENHDGGRHRRRDDRECVRNRGGERLLAVRVRP